MELKNSLVTFKKKTISKTYSKRLYACTPHKVGISVFADFAKSLQY